MAILDKSNMVDGNIIPASDVYQFANAFTGTGSYDILMSGSVAHNTSSIVPQASFFIKKNLWVAGGITGSLLGTASFAISSSYASLSQTAISASYASTSSYSQFAVTSSYTISASYASNAETLDTSSLLQTSTFNSFTSSYNTVSGSFNTRILSLSASVANPWRIFSGSTQVATYTNGKIIAGDNSQDVHFIVSGSGSFIGPVDATSFYQTSLKQFKENIFYFSSSALDIINTLEIVSFNYKKRDEFKIGIIADDTHEYISTKEHNVMDTTNSIGLLFKAVQELSKKVDDLIDKQ